MNLAEIKLADLMKRPVSDLDRRLGLDLDMMDALNELGYDEGNHGNQLFFEAMLISFALWLKKERTS